MSEKEVGGDTSQGIKKLIDEKKERSYEYEAFRNPKTFKDKQKVNKFRQLIKAHNLNSLAKR